MKWLREVPWWSWLALALLMVMVTLPAASRLEEQDSFCISCHTAPEQTYYDRAQAALSGETPFADLSSAHYGTSGLDFACIDCHRGDQGPLHRLQTFGLGAQDALVFFSGNADPTIEKLTTGHPGLVESGCIACHTDSMLVLGFNNHFHNLLPQSYEALQTGAEASAPPEAPDLTGDDLRSVEAEFGAQVAVLCLDCHRGHQNIQGSEQFYYLDVNTTVYPACVACHNATEKGPQRVEELSGG
jgi:hypothetical protein